MKQFYYLFLLVTGFAFSQIPSGYYSTATGTGTALKTQLFNIINNNTNSSSTANYGDLWTLYNETSFKDFYYDNDGTIVDLYTEIPTGTDTYTFTPITKQCGNYTSEGDCYNREHVIPKSYFGGSDVYPMYSDAHFVLPSDGYVNGKHNNYAYGVVGAATYTSSNGTKLGSSLNSGYSAGFSGIVFEPIDEFKGDIARAYFYFATCYQNQLATFKSNFSASEVSVMFDGTSFPAFDSTFLNILLTWNNLDPVSQYEINKNNAVYAFQGNRNPYIDHPEYVTQIWSNPLTTNDASIADFNIYPNPAKENTLYITASNTQHILQVEIFNILGASVSKQQLSNKAKEINISQLNKGIYLVKFTSKNGSLTKKLVRQ
ncbi:endonuclease [Mariniflexile maritimum]|uniref:endonuclease n=1 Tax=Mariniflexile maritimum TaxID=2682493 RepID=UPI0012F64580|nr:endonuclease [Mariniflexile maritimum]